MKKDAGCNFIIDTKLQRLERKKIKGRELNVKKKKKMTWPKENATQKVEGLGSRNKTEGGGTKRRITNKYMKLNRNKYDKSIRP